MRVGELARHAGVKIVTVRFYEARGLLPPATRRANGYRDFEPSTVARVRFIRRAQELGFSLAELREILRASDARAHLGPELVALAQGKLADLERRVRDLRRVQHGLRRLLKHGVKPGPCPIITSLGEPGRTRTAASTRPAR
jgi:DNA-binding transcriptional MerR regulator